MFFGFACEIVGVQPTKKNSLGTHRVPGVITPTENAENPPNRRAGACSRRAVRNQSKPSPVGKVSTKLTDEGLQAVGTAWCDALLTSIPHQSPTATALPQGKPEWHRTRTNRRAPSVSRRINAATPHPPGQARHLPPLGKAKNAGDRTVLSKAPPDGGAGA